MVDLYAGLGGWAEGGLAEGYDVVGFDIERHVYGEHHYPAQLVLQDILTVHGSQFRGAALIVASPPCQEYSYMAMPWSLAKAKAAAIRADTTGQMLADLNRLFDACFRIQAQASLAAGRHIPMVVENVRGAVPWVGRSRWNFGSFHLWGDVPALMPSVRAFKSSGMNWSDQTIKGQDFTRIAGRQTMEGLKTRGRSPSRDAGRKFGTHNMGSGERIAEELGLKRPGISFAEEGFNVTMARKLAPELKDAPNQRTEDDKRQHIGITRKAASAMIAKIPLPLSRHIAAVYRP
jgi:hypothetical protein